MNKRIKKLWIKALRSGEFRQTTSTLREGSGKSARYCCLGVLCELHRRHSKTPARWTGDQYAGEVATLALEVQGWAGMDDDNPIVKPKKNTLAGLNDDGEDFSYIADVIEKYL
jgi:hypothetical protein